MSNVSASTSSRLPAAPAAPGPGAPPAPPRANQPVAPCAPASGDNFQPVGRPENWHVTASTVSEAYEKVIQAQGKTERVSGQKVSDDSDQTNLDTGERLVMHQEEVVEGEKHHERTDFRQYDGQGTLRAELAASTEDDGHGRVHQHEEVRKFDEGGKPSSSSVLDEDREQGKTVRSSLVQN